MITYRSYQCSTIVNRSDADGSTVIGTVNPYRGCAHACAYCYVPSEKYTPYKGRPADAFFATVEIKTNAAELLEKTLPRLAPGILMIGSSTDPYQPAEREFSVTRSILETVRRHPSFGVHIFTKSDLILRDLDLLADIHRQRFACVSFSLITLNPLVAPLIEPSAPPPERRLEALRRLSLEKIPAGIALMPVLPYITDGRDIDKIAEETRKHGGEFIWYGGLNLRDRQRQRFIAFLEKNFPIMAEKYKNLYDGPGSGRETRENDLGSRLGTLCARYRLLPSPPFFRFPPPPRPGQLELGFDF